MTTLPNDTRKHEYDLLDPALLNLIGHAATQWATLEFYINDLIWKLTGTAPALGACVTSQIPSIDGRLRSLLSLLKLREASSKTIQSVNKFSENVRGPSDKRNKLVHDVWTRNENMETSKLQITANKSLVFKLTKIEIKDIKSDVDDVIDCVGKFTDIRKSILSELPTLPKIPEKALHPIRMAQGWWR